MRDGGLSQIYFNPDELGTRRQAWVLPSGQTLPPASLLKEACCVQVRGQRAHPEKRARWGAGVDGLSKIILCVPTRLCCDWVALGL